MITKLYKSSNSSDSGAIARAFGLVLEFLNDNEGVFVVMTSNDISQLPPELTRAGRLDALWYFSLPDEEERKQIFDIHIKKTGRSLDEDSLDLLANESDKYTGAEIELIVKSALRRSYLEKIKTGEDNGLTYEVLSKSIKDVIPIAVSSKEQITALERWAENRALFANKINDKEEKITINKKIKPLRL